jgi:ketosteroid isomerase-like protein
VPKTLTAAAVFGLLLLGGLPPAHAGDGSLVVSGAKASDDAIKGPRNVRIVLSLYQAFAEGDGETILDIIDPDVVWIESEGIPYGGTFIGRDAVFEGVFAKIAAEWDGFTAQVEEVISAGDQVITLGRDSGTFKATGKSMTAPTASIWTISPQGKVVKFVQYIDTQAVVNATLP